MSQPDMNGKVCLVTGLYFRGRHAIDSNSYSKDQAVQKRLWDVSVALTGLE